MEVPKLQQLTERALDAGVHELEHVQTLRPERVLVGKLSALNPVHRDDPRGDVIPLDPGNHDVRPVAV